MMRITRPTSAAAAAATTLAAFTLLLAGASGAEPPGAADCHAGSTFTTLADTGAWNWCQDPKAVTHVGEHRRTYSGWVSGDGSVVAAQYDHESGELITTVLHERLERDDHDNPAFLFLHDGRITAFYSPHGGLSSPKAVQGIRMRTTRFPEHIDYWTEPVMLEVNTGGRWGWTYPNVVPLADEGECGRVYLFWRGGDGRPTVSYSDDEGATWAAAANLIWSEGVRPYLKVVGDGYGRIHLAFTDGHPRYDPTNSLYYCFYERGAFYRADGTLIKDFDDIPVQPHEADRVYDARQDSVRAWVWDIALDPYDRPIIAYTNFPDVTDHRYRYARWNGGSWDDHEICSAGGWTVDADPEKHSVRQELWYSGGIALDHTDPSVVYLSRPVDGVFEIERWQTGDGGATWTHEPVTCSSENHNIRPVVPRDHTPDGPDVLWLHGDYIHYTDYETSVRMRVLSPPATLSSKPAEDPTR